MKHLNQTINESFFATGISDITDNNDVIKEIIKLLNKLKISYKEDDMGRRLYLRSLYGESHYDITFQKNMTSPGQRIAGAMYSSSQGDKWGFCVRIAASFEKIDELLDWAKKNGYYECNGYRCAQWGTWKFTNFKNIKDVEKFLKGLKDFI